MIKVTDISNKEYVEREMVLGGRGAMLGGPLPEPARLGERAEVLRITDIFRGKVVDVSPKSYAIEVTGSASKIHAIIDILRPLGIKEIVRTGTIAMARATKG